MEKQNLKVFFQNIYQVVILCFIILLFVHTLVEKIYARKIAFVCVPYAPTGGWNMRD